MSFCLHEEVVKLDIGNAFASEVKRLSVNGWCIKIFDIVIVITRPIIYYKIKYDNDIKMSSGAFWCNSELKYNYYL